MGSRRWAATAALGSPPATPSTPAAPLSSAAGPLSPDAPSEGVAVAARSAEGMAPRAAKRRRGNAAAAAAAAVAAEPAVPLAAAVPEAASAAAEDVLPAVLVAGEGEKAVLEQRPTRSRLRRSRHGAAGVEPVQGQLQRGTSPPQSEPAAEEADEGDLAAGKQKRKGGGRRRAPDPPPLKGAKTPALPRLSACQPFPHLLPICQGNAWVFLGCVSPHKAAFKDAGLLLLSPTLCTARPSLSLPECRAAQRGACGPPARRGLHTAAAACAKPRVGQGPPVGAGSCRPAAPYPTLAGHPQPVLQPWRWMPASLCSLGLGTYLPALHCHSLPYLVFHPHTSPGPLQLLASLWAHTRPHLPPRPAGTPASTWRCGSASHPFSPAGKPATHPS